MAFTTESLDVNPIANPTGPAEFDLPVKEFIGYDPKGTTTVTGSEIQKPDPKQVSNDEKKTPVAESPGPSESVTLSPKISALTRKEQAQRQREQALKQREAALEAKLADADKYAQLKAKIANKDYSAADELGMTQQEYTDYLVKKLNDSNPEEERYRKVEEKLSAIEKAQEEKTVQEYEANQKLWKAEIAKVIDANEEFSTIKDLNMQDAVLRHINDSFDEDDVELTAEEAARDIENELLKRAERFASVTKIKKKFEGDKVLGPPKTSPKTITQNMTVTSQQAKPKPFHLMSETEQIAEAIRRVQAAKLQR